MYSLNKDKRYSEVLRDIVRNPDWDIVRIRSALEAAAHALDDLVAPIYESNGFFNRTLTHLNEGAERKPSRKKRRKPQEPKIPRLQRIPRPGGEEGQCLTPRKQQRQKHCANG